MFSLFHKKNKIKSAQSSHQQDEANFNKRLLEFKSSQGVSTKRLNIGLWYLNHRHNFFIGIIIILSIASFILWGSSLYYFGSYILNGMTKQKTAIYELSTNNLNTEHADYLQNIKSKFIKVVPLESNRYDLVGSITNSNKLMWIEFDYYFSIAGQETEKRHGFVYPNENRFLFSLNQVIAGHPVSANLIVENYKWHRINTHEIKDWTEYRLDHLNFVVKDKKFFDSVSSGLTENLRFNRLSFLIINQTAYSYYEIPLNIIIYNKNNIVAVTHSVISNFESRQEKIIELSLLGYISNATHIDIRPDINIFDTSVFIPIN